MIEFADEVMEEQNDVFGKENMVDALLHTIQTFGGKALAAQYTKGLGATLVLSAVAFTVKFLLKGGFNQTIDIN